jgi:hypothetical protein
VLITGDRDEARALGVKTYPAPVEAGATVLKGARGRLALLQRAICARSSARAGPVAGTHAAR